MHIAASTSTLLRTHLRAGVEEKHTTCVCYIFWAARFGIRPLVMLAVNTGPGRGAGYYMNQCPVFHVTEPGVPVII